MIESKVERRKTFIIGIGSIWLDIIITSNNITPLFKAGGTCGNVVLGLGYLSFKVYAFSIIGADLAGSILKREFRKNNISTKYLFTDKNKLSPRIIEYSSPTENHKFSRKCPTCGLDLPKDIKLSTNKVSRIFETDLCPQICFFDRITLPYLEFIAHYKKKGSLIFLEPPAEELNNIALNEVSNFDIVKIAKPIKSTKNQIVKYFDSIFSKVDTFPIISIITLGNNGLCFKTLSEKNWYYLPPYMVKYNIDDCGAGDWLTIGFLYKIDEYARDNNISLYEVIARIDLIKAALFFGQAMAALSTMFYGARGMIDYLSMDKILNHIEKIQKFNYISLDTINMYYKKMKEAYPFKKINPHFCKTCLMRVNSD